MIRYNLISSVLVAAAALTGAGCNPAREVLGLNRNQPDEFTVIQTAPLTLPPNFNDLPTPNPGADRPQEASSREKARQALTTAQSDKSSGHLSQSTGEEAILTKAGANENPADIRQKVDKEANVESQDQDSIIKDLVSFKKKKAPGKVIDPIKESERLGNEKNTAADPN